MEEKLNAVSQMDMLEPYEQIIRQPIYNGLWDKCVNSFGISQRPSETSRDRSRDHCKIHRDAETVVLGFNIEPHKLWSLRLCVFYNGLWNGLWTSLTVSEKYRTNLQVVLKGSCDRSVAMKYSGEPSCLRRARLK